jgi:hypothetical protein
MRMKAAREGKLDDKVIEGADELVKAIKSKGEVDDSSAVREHLPTYNENADLVADLYPLDGLIEPSILGKIDISKITPIYSNVKKLKRLKHTWSKFTIRMLEGASPETPEKLQ